MRIVPLLLSVLIVAAGIAAALLIAKASLLYAALPLVAALAALGLSARAAFVAGAIAGLAVLTKTVSVAYGMQALSGGEILCIIAFALGCGTFLAAVAWLRRRSRIAAAVLVVAVVPVFIAGAVPLIRALGPVQLSSVYVPMRDQVKLAVDVYLPRGAAAHSLPTILRQTRYFRRTELHWPYSLLLGGMREEIRRFVNGGYAHVVVDARGSGASFGSRQQEWSDDEIRDGGEVVDWIVHQPWSTGKVGCTGVSYDGTACEMLLLNHHPAVKAAAPRFSLLDGYDDIAFPGGIHLSWFTENWGSFNDALDRNALAEKMEGFARRTIKGIAPVDGHEDLLPQAINDHKNNYDISGFAKSITYRDDAGPGGLTLARMSPFAKPEIAQSTVPIYNYSGWYDGAYQRAAISRFLSYNIPGSRLIIGAWDHGGRQNISPHNPPDTPVFDQSGELLRFFDLHLKGIDDGIGQQKPVRYYTMGAETWREADTWPPAAETRTLHFAAEHALSETAPPAAAEPDEYTVDLTATSGIGTRWHSYFNVKSIPIGYPLRAEQDRKLLTYTSAPLGADWEVTGHPALTLWVASNATDGQFFAYLEDVAPDGTVAYITEGLLRGLHRAVNPAPYISPEPWHSYRKEHGRLMAAGEPTEISFALLPTSYLVRKGHSIRVALAGADIDQFAPLPGNGPRWNVYRNAARASRIVLPIVETARPQ